MSINRMGQRRKSGQVVTVLNIFIGAFLIGSLTMMAYELSRLMLARTQLKAAIDAAALAGEATLASSTAGAAARTTAEQTALNLFRKNTILGFPMSSVTQAFSIAGLSPPPGQSQLYFEYLDPISKAPGGPTANVLRVYGAYNYSLFSGGLMGIGASTYTVVSSTTTALPALDLMIAFDVSNSNDDRTNVSQVVRRWDYTKLPPPGEVVYEVTPNPTGSGPPGEGELRNLFCSPDMGTAVNALPPQNLEAGYCGPSGCPKYFSEIGDPPNATKALRGQWEPGAPPGDAPTSIPGGLGPTGGTTGAGCGAGPQNYGGNTNKEYWAWRKPKVLPEYRPKDYTRPTLQAVAKPVVPDSGGKLMQTARAQAVGSWPGPPYMFTDLVTNLDGNTAFTSFNFAGYDFPNIGTVVEASRGNLENPAVASSAQVSLANLGVTPRTGYKLAYTLAAAQRLQPFRTVEVTTTNFMTKILQHTDCHFGFVSFADRAGNSAFDTVQNYNISWAYPQGNFNSFPLPLVGLSQAAGGNNYQNITDWLNPPTTLSGQPFLVPLGATNIADGLKTALDELSGTGARPGATRAVVLITDGTATRDLGGITPYQPPANGPACDDARAQAQRASTLGIPVYVVAVSQNGAPMDTYEDDLYNDQNNSPTGGGIAAISGHGAKYYRVNWASITASQPIMDSTFANIVRQLVGLVK